MKLAVVLVVACYFIGLSVTAWIGQMKQIVSQSMTRRLVLLCVLGLLFLLRYYNGDMKVSIIMLAFTLTGVSAVTYQEAKQKGDASFHVSHHIVRLLIHGAMVVSLLYAV